jgi:adhesin transport system outer membrane protein
VEDGFILKGIRIKFMYRKYCLRLQQARLVISMRHLIIVLFVLTSNQVFSNAVSELPSDEPYLALSLLDTVTLAVKNHPSIKAKVREVVATESDLSAAKLNTFPELSFSSQAVYNNENTRVLTLSQPIWAGGQLKATIEQAKALVDAAKGEMKSQESIIINETVAAFFNFVAADKKLSLYQANIEEHERLVGVITRRSSAQISPEIDVMLAKARLAQAQSQEAQIRTNRHIARAELEQLLGQPVS